MEINLWQIVSMVAIAAASGLVGVFALMRRMSLAADAISHIALPGLGLAFLFKINPLVGGAAALFLGALLIWLIENKSQINTDVVIGVVFSASLAIGSLLTPSEDLIEVLFGDFTAPNFWQIAGGLLLALLVIVFILLFKERLTISLISKDLAGATGINVRRLDLYFLLIFVLNVILGLQFLGVLLMGSLIIVPAAAARHWANSMNSTLFVAALIAIFAVLVGQVIAISYNLALGPTVISVATAVFILSLLKKSVQ